MSLTTDQLDNWFTYHPPTDEQKPKYAAIRDAELRCRDLEKHGTVTHDRVNATLRDFVGVIDAHAPDSADKTAAIRCVRIARNALNEALVLCDIVANAAAPSLRGQAAVIDVLLDEAGRQLCLARWQANSAIACGGK